MKTTQTQQILVILAANPDKSFTAAEITAVLGIPPGSSGTLLSDICELGQIERVSRGVYRAAPSTLPVLLESLTHVSISDLLPTLNQKRGGGAGSTYSMHKRRAPQHVASARAERPKPASVSSSAIKALKF